MDNGIESDIKLMEDIFRFVHDTSNLASTPSPLPTAQSTTSTSSLVIQTPTQNSDNAQIINLTFDEYESLPASERSRLLLESFKKLTTK